MFGHPSDGFIYSDEHMVYNSSNEHSPSVLPPGAMGFDFRPHNSDLTNFLAATIGSPYPMLHGGINIHPDDSDDGDDNDISDDSDVDVDDEQSDGDESSVGELDE